MVVCVMDNTLRVSQIARHTHKLPSVTSLIFSRQINLITCHMTF